MALEGKTITLDLDRSITTLAKWVSQFSDRNYDSIH